jgi:hypothetical protein
MFGSVPFLALNLAEIFAKSIVFFPATSEMAALVGTPHLLPHRSRYHLVTPQSVSPA